MSRHRGSCPSTEPVESHTVAPYRAEQPDGYVKAMRLRDFLNACPYQQGDVIYVERDGKPVKAIVGMVFNDYDRYDDRRPKYRVHLATAKGEWSRNWIYVWPGHIERGYALAGHDVSGD